MIKRIYILSLIVLLISCLTTPPDNPRNIVKNGDFEENAGEIMYWTTAGAKEIIQQLIPDIGSGGSGSSAKLVCSGFSGGTPSSHAMICQTGVVSIVKNTLYRLTFQAKQNTIKGGVVSIAIMDTKTWGDTGLRSSVFIKDTWDTYEIFFSAKSSVQQTHSRLQFWFKSTGILWLDNVELIQAENIKEERFPQVNSLDSANYIPNSSFECGVYGWGGFSPSITGWGGHVFQLIGVPDDTTYVHGKYSIRIDLVPGKMPVSYFDYFTPLKQPLTDVSLAHRGWIPLQTGKSYTVSAYLKSDKPQVHGHLLVRQAAGGLLRKAVTVTTEWKRYDYSFKAESDYVWIAAGMDLDASPVKSASLWIDAVQFEEGSKSSEYKPRSSLEIMPVIKEGNIIVVGNPPYNINLELKAYNNGSLNREEKIDLAVYDFFDKKITGVSVLLPVPPVAQRTKTVSLPVGKLGFYSVMIKNEKENMKVRYALIKPFTKTDSRFGMNHAYSWPYLIRSAHKAGIRWWRDWSLQWRLVQPGQEAQFDFSVPDIQINRVVKEKGNILALLPFPSSEWSSSIDASQARDLAQDAYRRKLITLSGKPENTGLFENYVSASVEHYKNKVRHFQICNEPLYTMYTLPAKLGYTLHDYIDLLSTAYTAVKKIDPRILVIGGMGAWPDNQWTKDFVENGGLDYVDILDVHLYTKGFPEDTCEPLVQLWQVMKKKGKQKPVWLTELGCYGEDEPSVKPFTFGDHVMENSSHPDEKDAAVWLVKFAALFFAHGGEKLFFHAGTCSRINEPDTGGVLFKYGGLPRKIYPAISAMATIIPANARFDKIETLNEHLNVYWFRTEKYNAGVAWAGDTDSVSVTVPANTGVLDIMGNEITGTVIEITGVPCYFIKPE